MKLRTYLRWQIGFNIQYDNEYSVINIDLPFLEINIKLS